MVFNLGNSSFTSTKTDTKYFPVGVLLMVTVLELPSNLLCNLHFIGFLNFGNDIVFVSKSTIPFWGTEKDCLLSCLLLNLGNPFLSLKNFVKALSRFSKLA